MPLQALHLNKDLCRCCHAEGSFDDLAQPYSRDGVEEVYSDMIKDSFNIEVNPVPGPLCVVTYKICKNCMQRVQDAFIFKNQVKKCELLFMEIYKKTISEKVKDVGLNSIVKEELSESDARDDYSPMNDYNDDDFCMKSEDSEDDATLIEIKSSKAKSKAPVKSKSKKGKEVKPKKIKEEVKKEEEGQKTESKKKKGVTEDDQNYTKEKVADGSDSYTCNVCKRVYKRKDSIKQHFSHVHLKQRPKVRGCYLCNDKVPGYRRAFHLEKVHGIEAPTCNACGKKFAYPYQVVRHQQTFHMGEKSFVCDICEMAFASRKNLTQHLIKHSTVRNFKCELCQEAFKLKKHLTQHLKVHRKRLEKVN